MQVITLNELVASGGGPCPDMVKIDAENSDKGVESFLFGRPKEIP